MYIGFIQYVYKFRPKSIYLWNRTIHSSACRKRYIHRYIAEYPILGKLFSCFYSVG